MWYSLAVEDSVCVGATVADVEADGDVAYDAAIAVVAEADDADDIDSNSWHDMSDCRLPTLHASQI